MAERHIDSSAVTSGRLDGAAYHAAVAQTAVLRDPRSFNSTLHRHSNAGGKSPLFTHTVFVLRSPTTRALLEDLEVYF